MCGIAGYINFDNHAVPQSFYNLQGEELLKAMLQKIGHRGPDHQHYVSKGQIGLAHARLKVLDLSDEANQPFIAPDQKRLLVFNGQIYNHGTLRKQSLFQDFKTHCDTETLLHSLLEKGENVLPELNGIFSFAYIDLENRQAILARDRFGVKPLYYYQSDTAFFFASEIQALLQIPKVHQEIDPQASIEYITLLAAQGERTIYKNIKKLETGTYLKIDYARNTVEKHEFWNIPTQRSYLKDSPEKIIANTEDLLIAAVQNQLNSDAPLGFFLSGGLDSSLLVAIAQRHAKISRPRCFTIQQNTQVHGFENDYPFAEKLSKDFGWHLQMVYKSKIDLASIDQILKIIEEPVPDLSALNVMAIAEVASKEGIKVLISGLGADDIFTGYRRHQLVALYKLLHWLPLKTLYQLFSKVLSKNNSLRCRLHKAAEAWDEDEDTFLLNLLLYTQINRSSACSFLENRLKKMGGDIALIDKALALEQMAYLPNQNLLYTDKASMRHGVEVRVPYLDNELCDYVYNIPTKLKIKGLETKYILKEIAKRYLPKEIIYRKKVGFSEPIGVAMRQELLEIIQKSSLSNYLEDPLIDKQLLLNLYANLKFGSMQHFS